MSILKKFFKNKKIFLFILFLVGWTILISQINLNSLADKVSSAGAYVVAFVVALFGGVSMFTSSSYIVTLVFLSVTDINPFLLALSAGTALTLGDALFYFFGKTGRKTLSINMKNRFDKLAKKLNKRPRIFMWFLVYIYTGFTPLPADILMIFASFAKYPFRLIILPLFLGNITLVLIIYHLARFGVDLIGI